jgi:3-deoxy-D-manno-octulosonic-acid transferase
LGQRFYQVFIRIYPFLIKLASPFNEKARLWTKGRVGILDQIRKRIRAGEEIIWIHCASLGEFEQGRPLLERLRTLYPKYKTLLTFFSPSGYEVRKDYDGADYIFYLPMDSTHNSASFYDIVHPRLVIFIKYEFWHYYLAEAKRRNIPLLLISAIFRKSQPFFSRRGGFHRLMLSTFTHFFVQNADSVSLLQRVGFAQNVSLTGDTRFDRVIEIAENFQPIASIENFCSSGVIVAGSTWLEDDKELAHYANTKKNVKFIIAPHNIGKDRLEECLKVYKNSMLFSSLQTESPGMNINTIIIDNIGMLSRLYKYGAVCYIGGGFGGDGVHNVLEAAVYGKPVVFGPEYEKYYEAIELLENGGATAIDDALELEATFDDLLVDSTKYDRMARASRDYVYSKRGSTEKILQFIQENRLLTN